MNKRIGVITGLKADGPCFKNVIDFGLSCCQLVSWNPRIRTEELADRVRDEMADSGINVTGFWAGWEGPAHWNFTQGPATLGIVSKEFREMRVESLKQAGDFAARASIGAVITHLGFIPENPADPVFGEVVTAVRQIAEHLDRRGLEFWFETGQETPVTLLRLITAVRTGNLGINLDPANLILYGKANPVDALDVFGAYVRNIHAKDGLYPTDPNLLGREVKVGTGRARFPEFVERLAQIGFTGEFIIEREISGDQQNKDIRETVTYLDNLLKG